ncbi:hypothetical protein Scep_026823 [Stephania cephalantha]|uniref:DUF4283 domain-containing protein n=1 Tax=Stephania cephalantha TaxID=152367 RepID=A0AAP0HQT8_9MAGN
MGEGGEKLGGYRHAHGRQASAAFAGAPNVDQPLELEETFIPWCASTMESFMRDPGREEKRPRRERSITMVLQVIDNARGRAMEMNKLYSGGRANVDRRPNPPTLQPDKERNARTEGGEGRRDIVHRVANEVIESRRQSPRGAKAVPIEISHVQLLETPQVEEVEKALPHGGVEMRKSSPVGLDRAILVCSSVEERDRIHKEGCERGHDLIYRVHLWNPDFHWMEQQWGGVDCLISIEVLLLNIWNIFAYRMLGDMLRGLMEVAPETLSRKNLTTTMLKVKGDVSKFFLKESLYRVGAGLQLFNPPDKGNGRMHYSTEKTNEGVNEATHPCNISLGGAYFALPLGNAINEEQGEEHQEAEIDQSEDRNVVDQTAFLNIPSAANLRMEALMVTTK